MLAGRVWMLSQFHTEVDRELLSGLAALDGKYNLDLGPYFNKRHALLCLLELARYQAVTICRWRGYSLSRPIFISSIFSSDTQYDGTFGPRHIKERILKYYYKCID